MTRTSVYWGNLWKPVKSETNIWLGFDMLMKWNELEVCIKFEFPCKQCPKYFTRKKSSAVGFLTSRPRLSAAGMKVYWKWSNVRLYRSIGQKSKLIIKANRFFSLRNKISRHWYIERYSTNTIHSMNCCSSPYTSVVVQWSLLSLSITFCICLPFLILFETSTFSETHILLTSFIKIKRDTFTCEHKIYWAVIVLLQRCHQSHFTAPCQALQRENGFLSVTQTVHSHLRSLDPVWKGFVLSNIEPCYFNKSTMTCLILEERTEKAFFWNIEISIWGYETATLNGLLKSQ